MSSSSSESEDERIKLCMEAVDMTLLSNSLYQNTKTESSEEQPAKELKSQRYLAQDIDEKSDLLVAETTQVFIAKKLADLINKQIKFVEKSEVVSAKKPAKSRIKLLQGFDCYVKPYEEFEYLSAGPQKQPKIKRRKVDDCEVDPSEEECLKNAIVETSYILSGQETHHWAKKHENPDKLFKYKATKKGTLVYKEPENEFTPARNKNQWHESKIKRLKK